MTRRHLAIAQSVGYRCEILETDIRLARCAAHQILVMFNLPIHSISVSYLFCYDVYDDYLNIVKYV